MARRGLARAYKLADIIVHFGAPAFGYIHGCSFNEPIGQVHQDRALEHVFQVAAEHHFVQHEVRYLVQQLFFELLRGTHVRYFHIGLDKFGFAADVEIRVVQAHVALAQICERVVDEYLGFEVWRIADEVGYTVELRFQVLQGIGSYRLAGVVIVHIKVFAAKVYPIELAVLYSILSKDLARLLSPGS